MKYDPEYNSYRFSSDDLSTIISSLYFYHQHSPILDLDKLDYISKLINSLEKTKDVYVEQSS